MVLVYGTVTTSTARVGQVTSNGTLEEALTTFTRKLSVVLARTLITTDDAFDTGLFTSIATATTASRSTERRTLRVMLLLTCSVVVDARSGACTVQAGDAYVRA